MQDQLHGLVQCTNIGYFQPGKIVNVKIIVESIVGSTGGSGMFLQKATAKHERLVTLHIGSRHIQQSCSSVGELGVYRTDHYKNKRKSISLLIADTGYRYPCTSPPAPLQRCSGNGSPKRTVFFRRYS